MSMFGDNAQRDRALTHLPAYAPTTPGGGPAGAWSDYNYKPGEPTWWTGYGRRQVADVYGNDPNAPGLGPKEAEALGALQQLASGEKSYAREQAALQQDATDRAVRSQVAGAQRGGYDPSAGQAGAWASANAQQQIGAQGQIAAQRERQLAARALAQGAAGAMGRRQQLLGIQQGYTGIGAEERYRQQLAKAQGTDYMLRGKRGGASLYDEADKTGRRYLKGGLKAIGSLAAMAGGMGG